MAANPLSGNQLAQPTVRVNGSMEMAIGCEAVDLNPSPWFLLCVVVLPAVDSEDKSSGSVVDRGATRVAEVEFC